MIFCELIDRTVLKLSLLAHEDLKLQRKRVLCQTYMVGEIHSEAKKQPCRGKIDLSYSFFHINKKRDKI